jgi:putative DNA primase/helicase
MDNKENIKKLIKNDILGLIDSIAPVIKTPDDILKELSNSIGQIDFKILAFPDIDEVNQQIEVLKPFVYNEDGSFNKENKTEFEQYKQLNKKLASYKLSKNHYLVLCVEQLLKIAKANNWGLCKKNGFIYLYNGSYWSEINQESFQYFLGSVSLKMGVEKFKAKIHTFKDELFKQFMADAYLRTPQTNGKNVLINLENGTFEITPTKRTLKVFDRNDFLTHQLPFEYNPDASAPLFKKYLDEVLPDVDKQKVLAEYCGYIFVKPSVLKLEKALIMFGTGANGKSVFFEILNALLGSENFSSYSLEKLTTEDKYRIRIANKLVNYASEMSSKLDVDTFKQMVSGEPIEARSLYKDPIIMTDYAKFIFNSNELPKDVEHTNAFFRRFLILGFDVTIPEDQQDKELSNKIIQGELSGVFNWILQGLDRLLKQKKFSKCAAVENARSDYEKQSDSVKMFIDDFEYKTSTDYTPVSELYNQYKSYCIDDGLRPVKKSNFMKRLEHHKIFLKRINPFSWCAFVRTDKSHY